MPDTGGVRVRPLLAADVPAAQECGYESLREAGPRYGWTMPALDDLTRERGQRRVAHLLHTDPEGVWVADQDGVVVGVALASRRDGLWFLSLLTVDPRLQGGGVGRRLLEAALTTYAGATAGMLVASSDPKALRRYGIAGFALHPGYDLVGPVDRALLPAVRGVREGDWDRDREHLDELGRRLRGAAYGPDLDAFAADGMRLLVEDDGVAVLREGRLVLLAALQPATAQDLLWAALAEATDEVEIAPFPATQQWALEVALRARLSLRPGESLCLRGAVGPLTPYLPSGTYG